MDIQLKNRYCHTRLCKNGCEKHWRIHILVAKHFILNPLNKPQVNHIKVYRFFNFFMVLEWCTAKENVEHAKKLGLIPNGNNRWNGKFSNNDILDIRKMKKDGMRVSDIATLMFTSNGTISQICNNKTYTHVQA